MGIEGFRRRGIDKNKVENLQLGMDIEFTLVMKMMPGQRCTMSLRRTIALKEPLKFPNHLAYETEQFYPF